MTVKCSALDGVSIVLSPLQVPEDSMKGRGKNIRARRRGGARQAWLARSTHYLTVAYCLHGVKVMRTPFS